MPMDLPAATASHEHRELFDRFQWKRGNCAAGNEVPAESVGRTRVGVQALERQLSFCSSLYEVKHTHTQTNIRSHTNRWTNVSLYLVDSKQPPSPLSPLVEDAMIATRSKSSRTIPHRRRDGVIGWFKLVLF